MVTTNIIAVVGASGSGKTTGCTFASKALGIPLVCSYTTRPMREGETDGIDHYFVSSSEVPERSKMAAYTKFGDYEYWVTHKQLKKYMTCIYIIDEAGLISLLKSRRYLVSPILIKRHEDSIGQSVEQSRIDRDRGMFGLIPEDLYRTIIYNDSTIERLQFDLTSEIYPLRIPLYKPSFIQEALRKYIKRNKL